MEQILKSTSSYKDHHSKCIRNFKPVLTLMEKKPENLLQYFQTKCVNIRTSSYEVQSRKQISFKGEVLFFQKQTVNSNKSLTNYKNPAQSPIKRYKPISISTDLSDLYNDHSMKKIISLYSDYEGQDEQNQSEIQAINNKQNKYQQDQQHNKQMLEYFLNSRKCRKAFLNELEFDKNQTYQNTFFPKLGNSIILHTVQNVQVRKYSIQDNPKQTIERTFKKFSSQIKNEQTQNDNLHFNVKSQIEEAQNDYKNFKCRSLKQRLNTTINNFNINKINVQKQQKLRETRFDNIMNYKNDDQLNELKQLVKLHQKQRQKSVNQNCKQVKFSF